MSLNVKMIFKLNYALKLNKNIFIVKLIKFSIYLKKITNYKLTKFLKLKIFNKGLQTLVNK